jgi:hypothetical protein
MQAELRDIEPAAAASTHDAGRGLKTELQRQIASAGLGQRLANSWLNKHYPNQKLDAASLVYTQRAANHPGLRGHGHPERGADAFSRFRPRTRPGRAPMAGGAVRLPSRSTGLGRFGLCRGQAVHRSWS